MVYSKYSGFLTTKKTDRHNITEILLKVAFKNITLTHNPKPQCKYFVLELLQLHKGSDKQKLYSATSIIQ